jgi:hypothetical protein
MADTGDLKSPEGDLMRVRVPPQALAVMTLSLEIRRGFSVRLFAAQTALPRCYMRNKQ